MQTTTPLSLLTLPSKDALVKEFVGKNVNSLRTPALIVDKSVFKRNCERVTKETERRGMGFRAHVKSESTSRWAYVQNRARADYGERRRMRASC
jgi:D-serine deaminase-like pyridoxal phosphate-dependent protein